MRILYHFSRSPFSRRARLCLAFKGLDVELREARQTPAFLDEAKSLSPLNTVPVFVDEGGIAIGDSTAISHYLDRAYPSDPALWPADAEGAPLLFETASLIDGALNALVNFGTRLYPMHTHEAWEGIKSEAVRRAQGALDALAKTVPSLGRSTIAKAGWSAGDIWLFTGIQWIEGLPARAPTFPLAAQVMTLGYKLPDALARWADAHRDRPEIRALEA